MYLNLLEASIVHFPRRIEVSLHQVWFTTRIPIKETEEK